MYSSTNYNDASDQWLGNEWSEKTGSTVTGSGSNSVSVVSMLSSGSKTSAWTALESEFTWLDWDDVNDSSAPLGLKYTDVDGNAAYATSVKVESSTRVEHSTS